jgi:8-oxo-dGTP pyrophosphatase MutT (NUDIX family)
MSKFEHLTEEFITECLRNAEHSLYYEKPFDEFTGSLKRAAVLIPLTRVDDEWHILYTRRTDVVEHHKSQVSFPGGRTDPEDPTPEATALREADEEVGIRPEDVRILGRLGEMMTVTNYLVTPVVGIFPWPYAFRIHTVEVGRVFTLPLEWLADRNNYMEFTRAETNRGVIIYFPFDGELLWGATARMTVALLQTLNVLEKPSP